jgi:hypothetical protein
MLARPAFGRGFTVSLLPGVDLDGPLHRETERANIQATSRSTKGSSDSYERLVSRRVPAVPDKLRSALKPAQAAALAELETGGLSELTRARYEEIGAVSRSQAAYDLADMVTLGILERVGTGRATRYRLQGSRIEQDAPHRQPPKQIAERPRGGTRRGGRKRKWTDDRIRSELEAFCAANGHWPRASEFRQAGRIDLYLAASRYGGIDYWAAELGLRERPTRRPRIRIPATLWQRTGGWALAGMTMAAVIGIAALLIEVDRGPWRLVSAGPAEEGEPLARTGGRDGREGPPAERSAPREQSMADSPAEPAAGRAGSGPQAAFADVRLVARGGSCWLSVRRGSAAGQTAYEGTLVSGRELRLRGKRLWLRLGAPHNLVARLDGRRLDLPERTSTVLITRRGLRVLREASPAPPEEPEIDFEAPVLASSTVTTSSPTGSGGSPSPEPAPSAAPPPSPDPKPRKP